MIFLRVMQVSLPLVEIKPATTEMHLMNDFIIYFLINKGV